MPINRQSLMIAACWLVSLMIVFAYAQKKAPENTSKILLENERVRVKEVTFLPGVKPGKHTHALAHIGVIIEGGKLQFIEADGKIETREFPAGGVGYRDKNVTHEVINVGPKPLRVIEVELK